MNDTYSMTTTPTLEQVLSWARVSGDNNPVHYDNSFTKSMGLPGPIVHGQLVVSILLDMVDTWLGQEGYIIDFSFAFRSISYPDYPLVCKGSIASKNDRTYSLNVSAEDTTGHVHVEGIVTVQLCS